MVEKQCGTCEWYYPEETKGCKRYPVGVAKDKNDTCGEWKPDADSRKNIRSLG
ncbi:MAG: hypothetical protein GY820_38730 [Gammaproteobacteria bacterium]|nr:hypothetical protein [Gammaproteobacteria bacterium]